MQGIKMRYFIGGVLMALSSQLPAETLQPDPAWQQGKLDNGFSWQLLQTPQRPNDRIQLRLVVKTGSMVETASQRGFTYLIPKMALFHSKTLSDSQLQQLWHNAIDPAAPIPPAIVSYDVTLYNLSLPNNRPELLKEALQWLAGSAAGGQFDKKSLMMITQLPKHLVVTHPANVKDPLWRARIKGSTLIGHEPGAMPVTPVKLEEINKFVQQWYTPDIMTLYVAGHVDSRTLTENINQVFSTLSGKRSMPVTMATLPVLTPQIINLTSLDPTKDTLSLTWDFGWRTINDSEMLKRYWRDDLARETIFRSIKQAFDKKYGKTVGLNMDCRIQYQRASCALLVSAAPEKMKSVTESLLAELSAINNKGVSQAIFEQIVQEKQQQLDQLFAAYARVSTDILINQRLISQQNGVIDIAPEQFQRLRQAFLAELTLALITEDAKRLVAQEPSFIFSQPADKRRLDIDQIRNKFKQVLWSAVATPAAEQEVNEGSPVTRTN